MLAICSHPRAGGHMLLSLLESSGVPGGEWPDRMPEDARVALIHHHYIEDLPFTPERVILLLREDILGAAVSWEIARTTGNWFEGDSPALDVDPARVLGLSSQVFASRWEWIKALSLWGSEVVILTYEDLCQGRWRNAIEFFGGDPERAKIGTSKQGNISAEVYSQIIRDVL